MIYDILVHQRSFQQSYLRELPGHATQTSQSYWHTAIQRRCQPFQRQIPQGLQMKTCQKAMTLQRHRPQISDTNGEYRTSTLPEYTTGLERLCSHRPIYQTVRSYQRSLQDFASRDTTGPVPPKYTKHNMTSLVLQLTWGLVHIR